VQGFCRPKNRDELVERSCSPFFSDSDHIAPPGIRNSCRRRGVQIGRLMPAHPLPALRPALLTTIRLSGGFSAVDVRIWGGRPGIEYFLWNDVKHSGRTGAGFAKQQARPQSSRFAFAQW